MQTILTASAAEAAQFIRAGAAVAFPTETVYGLGASVWSATGIASIFAAKGRPADNPLIVHLADLQPIHRVAAAVSPTAQALLQRFSPGPLTVVLPRHADVPGVVTAGLDTVGIRVPAHALARAFLQACDVPVAAPSANRSGRPSPTTWQAVYQDLHGRVPCILQGDASPVGLESTVVDCVQEPPVLLRAGAITLEALQTVCPHLRLASPGDSSLQRSPGTRYRHYAPSARVHLVRSAAEVTTDTRHAFIGLERPSAILGRVQVVADTEEYAHHLFAFFRACDADGLTVIHCQTVPPTGLGRALMDRLERAAAGP